MTENRKPIAGFKRPRQRNETHLKFIRSLPCVACGDNTSTEAAHVRMEARQVGKRPVGKGEKPDDIWTVPLCSKHSRELHKIGELEFWSKYQTMPIIKCLALWAHTGQYEIAEQIVRGG